MIPAYSRRVTMTFLLSLLVVILAIAGISNPLSHSDGDSSIDDTIANLTAAINQLLTQSSHSCPVSSRSDSHNSLTDLMQLQTASTPDVVTSQNVTSQNVDFSKFQLSLLY